MSNFLNRIRATWNPNRYHGWGKQKNFFEGWYFKLVDHSEQYALAIIPGIAMDANGKKQAFIQVLDDIHSHAEFHAFPFEHFSASADHFECRIGANIFSLEGIELDLPKLKGNIKIDNIVPWPKSSLAPGIMGWYSFVPFMQCYHGIVSMHHNLNGNIQIRDKEVTFKNAKGYIEKDWGRSFPRAWIWMQCNHFDSDKDVSLCASTAHVPWMGNYFIGFIVGLYIDGVLVRFATYLGSKIKVEMDGDIVHLEFRNKKEHLEITAEKAKGSELISPISGDMIGKVEESIRSKCSYKYYQDEKLVKQGSSSRCAMELAGDVDVLLES